MNGLSFQFAIQFASSWWEFAGKSVISTQTTRARRNILTTKTTVKRF